ncbi:MAG TPA: hypothetical protein PLN19_03340, partial [Methanothrix sp.]|nr:hypothetical protein [Methanothrix sp.]
MISVIRKFILPALLLAAILISGCISQNGQDSGGASGRIKVAATIAPLGEFVEAVGGDRVTV